MFCHCRVCKSGCNDVTQGALITRKSAPNDPLCSALSKHAHLMDLFFFSNKKVKREERGNEHGVPRHATLFSAIISPVFLVLADSETSIGDFSSPAVAKEQDGKLHATAKRIGVRSRVRYSSRESMEMTRRRRDLRSHNSIARFGATRIARLVIPARWFNSLLLSL